MTDRPGIGIDDGPACQRVCLDRREPDDLIDRSAPPVSSGSMPEALFEVRSRSLHRSPGLKDSEFDEQDPNTARKAGTDIAAPSGMNGSIDGDQRVRPARPVTLQR
jgi:Zn-finger nucleic acid-binding protein